MLTKQRERKVPFERGEYFMGIRTPNKDMLDRVERYIKGYQKENGKSPTYRQIMHETGMTTLSSVFRYVNALEKEGRIAKTTQGNIATPQNLRRGGTTMIPLVGSVACGAPNIGVEEIEETYAFPTELFGEGEMFMLRTYGDSMIDIGISKDDLIVVKKQNYANDGDIVVALVDGETTLKWFYRKGSKIILHPENKTMKDIITEHCEIQGILVSCIKMY